MDLSGSGSPSPKKRKAKDQGPAPKKLKCPKSSMHEQEVRHILQSASSSDETSAADLAERLLQTAEPDITAQQIFQIHFCRHKIIQKLLQDAADTGALPEERRLLNLMMAIEEKHSGFMDSVISAAIHLLQTHQKANPQHITHICRLVGLLCKQWKEEERSCMPVIVYDLLVAKPNIASYAVLAFASVCPDPLRTDKGGWLINCIKFVIYDILAPKLNGRENLSKVGTRLTEWLGWSTSKSNPADSAESVADAMVTGMLASLSQASTLQNRLAIQLLAQYMGWIWTNDTLVVRHIWPALGMWATEKPEEGEKGDRVGVKDGYAAQLIKVLGAVVWQCPLQSVSSTKAVINMIVEVYQNKESTCVKEACLGALLQLAPIAPDLIRSSLQTVVIDPKLQTRLEATLNQATEMTQS